MISNRLDAWRVFSNCVLVHIEETEKGHYGGPKIQPLDFLEQWFSMDALAWQVCKYLCRYPVTRNQKDLLKAADYLCRLWVRGGFPRED